jgi:hypothetical protein
LNRESITASRWLKWLAITVACAAPLHVAVMSKVQPPELAAEALALATWATGMTLLEAFVAWRCPVTWGRALTIGFAAWAVVQGVLALFSFGNGGNGGNTSRIGNDWITPYVWSAMPGLLLMNGLDGFGPRESGAPLAVYVLTVSCGLFNFAAGLLATAAVASFTRPRRSPPPDTAPSPAPPP